MSVLALKQTDLLRVLQAGNARYVILGINLLLVIWIASQLATLTWGLLAPKEEAASAQTTTRARPVQPDPDRQLIAQLPGWHLLGVPRQTTAAPVKDDVPANAPDTRLQLTLRGALASDEPGGARAIIADSRGNDEKYAIGDILPGNAELSEIYPDRVILKRSGRYETLRLPEDASPPGNARNRRAARPASRIGGAGGNPQARLAAVRQQLNRNPATMAGLLRASVHKDESGNMIGYTLSPGNDPEMFAELGLVEGDVALQVNDMELSDPNNSAQALRALRSGEPVTVRLLRDGQEQVVSIDGL